MRYRTAAERPFPLLSAARAQIGPIDPMRFLLLVLALGAVVPFGASAAPAAAVAPPPAIGCPSLANLRLLLRQAKNDAGAAAAMLADDKADHLGCAVVARETVSRIAEHLSLNGNAYDCLTLRTTAICQWVVAGTVAPAGATPGKSRSGDKGRAPEKATPPEKAAPPEKARR